MIPDKKEYLVDVLKSRRVFILRSQSVVEIDKGKSTLCKAHAVELILLLASINPAASMDTDDRLLWLRYLFLMINIEQIGISVWSIGNIIKSYDILRCCQALISFVITDLPVYPDISYYFTNHVFPPV